MTLAADRVMSSQFHRVTEAARGIFAFYLKEGVGPSAVVSPSYLAIYLVYCIDCLADTLYLERINRLLQFSYFPQDHGP